MTRYSIQLFPRDHRLMLRDRAAFINDLKAAGFLGEDARDEHDRLLYQAGSRAVEYMEVDPNYPPEPENLPYLYTILDEDIVSQERAEFLNSGITDPPLCPSCGYHLESFVELFNENHDVESDWHCPNCDTTTPIPQLDWQDSNGAIARTWIMIQDRTTEEIMPTDALMILLQQLTGVAWSYHDFQV